MFSDRAHDVSRPLRRALMALAAAALAACGGGGASPAATETPASVVSGAVVKGPVASATVCAFELLPTGKGKGLACTLSGEDGSYSLSLDYTGPVIVEASGGYYTDEASGTADTLLGAPLSVAGIVGPGTQTLMATPLTSLALAQAVQGGNLTVSDFGMQAVRVAAAFGLPDSVDIVRSLPSVSGAANAYGQALITVSKMLGQGATLAGIIANTDLAGLAQGALNAGHDVCGTGTGMMTLASISDTPPAGVYFHAADSETAEIVVLDPSPQWLSLLPEPGAVMGCTLTARSPAQVSFNCPVSGFADVTLLAEGSTVDPPASLPASGFVAAGRRIDVTGKGIFATGLISIFANVISFPDPTQSAGGAAGTPVTISTVTLENPGGSGITISDRDPIGTIGTPGSIPGSGAAQLCIRRALTPAGVPTAASQGLTAGGGGIVTSVGTLLGSGGSVVVTGNGSGLALSGVSSGSGTPAAGSGTP